MYSEAKEDDKVTEVTPPDEVPEQALEANAGEEEEAASNPPLTEDAPITLDKTAPANVEEEELAANTVDDVPRA